MMTTQNWKDALQTVSRPDKIKIYQRYFKTGPGEYAEGDIFIGVTVPDNRQVARTYIDAPANVLQEMLDSPIHEHRLSALIAMVLSYARSKRNPDRRNEILQLYFNNIHRCNNWDLVDCSCPHLLGPELAEGRYRDIQDRLSSSELLWARRVAIVSTLHLVMKHRRTEEALEQCQRHISDPEPLIHKAVGWILREVGKKDMPALLDFLDANIESISATTLSYATERFDIETRHQWQNRRKSLRK